MKCPHCDTELKLDDDCLCCSKCGFLLSIEWIKNIYNLIKRAEDSI